MTSVWLCSFLKTSLLPDFEDEMEEKGADVEEDSAELVDSLEIDLAQETEEDNFDDVDSEVADFKLDVHRVQSDSIWQISSSKLENSPIG